MNRYERFLEVIEDDEGEEEDTDITELYERSHQKLVAKNKAAVSRFLGKDQRMCDVATIPWYYDELLSWALKRYMEREGWQAVRTLGYRRREPIYIEVDTDYDQQENLLMDGQMLLEKGSCRLIVSVDLWRRNYVLVEGPTSAKEEIHKFVLGVHTTAREQNFYRGKKLEFGGKLRFLDLNHRSWDSIILDEGTEKEIKANTIGFLARREHWAKYNIPAKRGILLVGEPGTGKTIICKALMSEADGLTCITSSAYSIDFTDYITELYQIAEDLSPCLVLLEDIDIIGLNREEFGYQRGPAMLSLLSALDGIEEKNNVVTVATTNRLETIDKALSERPSRFDRVITLSRPKLEQRRKLVNRICTRIPLAETLQKYIAYKTDGCTPAQIQEVIYSLVIENPDMESDVATFSEYDMDRITSKVKGRKGYNLGFCNSDGNNGTKPDSIDTAHKI